MASKRVTDRLPQTARTLFGAAAAFLILGALPGYAQQITPENLDALPAAPIENLVSWNAAPPIERPAPVQLPPALNNDRLFFVLPNYLMVENQDQIPSITAKTKFKFSYKTMSDPVTISFLGGLALIGQARNSDPSYGQGLQGYGKRYATLFADTGIGTLMTASVFPTVLHQDPRYFQLGHGGARRRALYAITRLFITRGDNGNVQFNYSEIVGNAVAAGISNAYHPASQRTLGGTLSVWGTDMMLNALCNVAKEFWPDIRRKIRKPKDQGLRQPVFSDNDPAPPTGQALASLPH